MMIASKIFERVNKQTLLLTVELTQTIFYSCSMLILAGALKFAFWTGKRRLGGMIVVARFHRCDQIGENRPPKSVQVPRLNSWLLLNDDDSDPTGDMDNAEVGGTRMLHGGVGHRAAELVPAS